MVLGEQGTDVGDVLELQPRKTKHKINLTFKMQDSTELRGTRIAPEM